MVSIAQQESSVAHYSNSREEDGVSCSYDSMNSLIEDIKGKGSMFEAISLCHEINRLNGYRLITDYHIRIIKSHIRESHIVKYKSELAQSRFVDNETMEIKVDAGQRGFTESKMRDLQKGYMKLLSV